MKYAYMIEKTHSGLHYLAGTGSLKERILNAFVGEIIHIERHELPDEVREQYAAIKNQLSKPIEFDKKTGLIAAHLDRLSESDLLKLSRQLVDLCVTAQAYDPLADIDL